jgi:glycosyltransferase involved in cell wall biosynthesis
MVTDDVQIDRRILLEAESLTRKGHEVILIAEPGVGNDSYERIDSIKVERFHGPSFTPTEHFILHVSSIVSKLFARISAICLAAVSYLSILISKVFSFFIILNQYAANKTLKAIRRLRLIPLHETALVGRICYYEPDILHIHDLPRLRVGALAKKKLQVPLIYDAHELYPEIGTLTSLQKKILSKKEKRFIKDADAVITVNEYIAAELANRYKIKLPEVIFNSTRWPKPKCKSECFDRFREHFGIDKGSKIILYQGWMSTSRGLQELTRAMKFVPEFIHLIFMGYGEALGELKEIAQVELKMENRIHFMDAVSQEDLLMWTASADAGIIPYQPVDLNNYFCSPNKLFEFIQAELPIIANDLPFLRKVLEGEGFGIVHKLKIASDYGEAINKMFDESAETLQFCKENLRNKRSKFCWDNEEEKLLKIYESLKLS